MCGSAVNAVSIVTWNESSMYMACASIDQRLTLWKFVLDDKLNSSISLVFSAHDSSPNNPVSFCGGAAISIADVSDMQFFRAPEDAIVASKKVPLLPQLPQEESERDELVYSCVVTGEGIQTFDINFCFQHT